MCLIFQLIPTCNELEGEEMVSIKLVDGKKRIRDCKKWKKWNKKRNHGVYGRTGRQVERQVEK